MDGCVQSSAKKKKIYCNWEVKPTMAMILGWWWCFFLPDLTVMFYLFWYNGIKYFRGDPRYMNIYNLFSDSLEKIMQYFLGGPKVMSFIGRCVQKKGWRLVRKIESNVQGVRQLSLVSAFLHLLLFE